MVMVMLLIVLLIALKALSAVPPCSIITTGFVSKFRDCSTKLLSKKNIVLKFKDTEQKETLCRIYPTKWEEVHNTQAS